MDNDTKYWPALNRIHGIGGVMFTALRDRSGSLDHVWNSSPADLRSAGLAGQSAGVIPAMRPRISPNAELERLDKAGREPSP